MMDKVEAEEFGETYWKPEHGRRVKFKTIDLVWLRNIKRHVDQRLDHMLKEERAGWSVMSSLQGEMALDAVESRMRHLEDALGDATIFAIQLTDYLTYRERVEATATTRLGHLLAAKFAA